MQQRNALKSVVAIEHTPRPINTNSSAAAIDSPFLDGSGNLTFNTLLPYQVEPVLQDGDKTGDIVHRYWNQFAQIDGGKNDKYIAWSDNPGLVMSYFDAITLPEGLLAQQYGNGNAARILSDGNCFGFLLDRTPSLERCSWRICSVTFCPRMMGKGWKLSMPSMEPCPMCLPQPISSTRRSECHILGLMRDADGIPGLPGCAREG